MADQPSPAVDAAIPKLVRAGMIDLPDGRRVWIPPGSRRAYWAHLPVARDLTDEEMAEVFGEQRKDADDGNA